MLWCCQDEITRSASRQTHHENGTCKGGGNKWDKLTVNDRLCGKQTTEAINEISWNLFSNWKWHPIYEQQIIFFFNVEPTILIDIGSPWNRSRLPKLNVSTLALCDLGVRRWGGGLQREFIYCGVKLCAKLSVVCSRWFDFGRVITLCCRV